MPIKFPTVHIAESVKNRILNLSDELSAPAAASGKIQRPPLEPATPAPADPAAHGMALDAQLSQPAPEMPPAETSGPVEGDQVVPDVAQGGNAISSLLAPPGFLRPPE